MAFRERCVLAAELQQRMRSTRERLDAALQAMDYNAALDRQIEFDDLESKMRVQIRRYGTRPFRLRSHLSQARHHRR
jgi:hypothetical protein